MGYYEFFNLPTAAGWEDAAAEPTSIEDRPGDNQWSEVGGPQSLRISLSLSASPNNRGWVGTGPRFATAVINRSVRLHGDGDKVVSPNIAVGDLLLYRVALLSTDATWTAESGAYDRWPGAYLELDTRNGVRLKATLKRLAIQDWRLSADIDEEGKLKSLRETLVFRAWVIKLENTGGNALLVALGDSGRADA
ncbi:MAG: hypothetical protein E5V36_00570 [Mesorhizobium sp.]|nr:MAG: hypothetical protein E5V36_00570 [Mesorhizobium sp.]